MGWQAIFSFWPGLWWRKFAQYRYHLIVTPFVRSRFVAPKRSGSQLTWFEINLQAKYRLRFSFVVGDSLYNGKGITNYEKLHTIEYFSIVNMDWIIQNSFTVNTKHRKFTQFELYCYNLLIVKTSSQPYPPESMLYIYSYSDYLVLFIHFPNPPPDLNPKYKQRCSYSI